MGRYNILEEVKIRKDNEQLYEFISNRNKELLGIEIGD